MLRIGIAGSDNSHAVQFARLINVEGMYGTDVRVTAICGQDAARTREVAEQTRIDRVVDAPEDMVALVDAAMVVHRHGDLHAPNALPFIAAGLPVFVDKPFAISLADARGMLAAARRSGARVTSYSALRFSPDIAALAGRAADIGPLTAGVFAGHCDFDSEYGGAFFYATHSVEMALRLFGEDVEAVSAVAHGGNVVAVLRFAAGALVTLNLLGRAKAVFYAQVFGLGGNAGGPIGATGNYEEAVRRFLALVSEGTMPLTEEQLLTPVAVVHAIVRSAREGGRTVALNEILSAT